MVADVKTFCVYQVHSSIFCLCLVRISVSPQWLWSRVLVPLNMSSWTNLLNIFSPLSIHIPCLSYNKVLVTRKEKKKTEHFDRAKSGLDGTDNGKESTTVCKQSPIQVIEGEEWTNFSVAKQREKRRILGTKMLNWMRAGYRYGK